MPTHVRVTDAQALLDAWTLHPELGDFIVTRLDLDRPSFRKWAIDNLRLDEFGVVRVKRNGRPLPGVDLVPEHTTLRVRT